ncbi:MAG: hypothetical protein Kow0062_11180 [Acidobacteriota bacterium]
MQFSSADKALYLKIVYYGPGLSGKTTNLETIHRITDPEGRQKMVSLRTQEDRTLFFDLLPFDLGRLYGLNIRVKLYTVPGQIQYDTTRRQVLAGADGVVFVADSQRRMFDENVRMVRYLVNNLKDNGLDPQTIPLVFQWNKRDLPDVVPEAELAKALDYRGVPAIASVATTGVGVMETFREITVRTLEHLARQAPGVSDRMRSQAVREDVEKAFAPFLGRTVTPDRPAAVAVQTPQKAVRAADTDAAAPADKGRAVFGLDDLLSEAVHANLAMSEQLLEAHQKSSHARRDREALAGLVATALSAGTSEDVLRATLDALVRARELPVGSLLLGSGRPEPLRAVAHVGREHDPLNAIVSPGLGSVATSLLERGEPVLCHDIAGELLFGQPSAETEGLRGVLAVPFGPSDPPRLLLLAYAAGKTRDLTRDDLDYARLVAGIASLALRAVLARKAAAPAG